VKLATRDGFGKAICELGADERIVVLAASVGDSTRAYKFREKFPARYIEAGIAEQNMIGMASGLALGGMVPFATSFCTFLPGRCYDQIRQSVCYSNLNVKLVATHAGITVGADGATHQMMEDLAMLRALPGLTIMVPADSLEAEKATLAAAKIRGPCYLRLSREPLPLLKGDATFEVGKAQTLREGSDVTIAACGIMTYYALLAAETLAASGISARVLNVHTLKPIDAVALERAARETGGIVTAEEHQVIGGLGSAVAETLAERYPVPVRRVGMLDRFGESGQPAELLQKHGMTADAIVHAAKELLWKKPLPETAKAAD